MQKEGGRSHRRHARGRPCRPRGWPSRARTAGTTPSGASRRTTPSVRPATEDLRGTIVEKLLDDQMAGAAPGERGGGPRAPRRGGHPFPGLAAGRPARRSRSRRVPEGLRGRGRRLRGVSERRVRHEPRVPRDHRDHRPPRDVQAAGGGDGRRADTRALPARPPRRHRHGRLGPAPQAVAMGQGSREARCGRPSPRTATRPSRATRDCCWPRAAIATAASRTSGPSTPRSAGSPGTAAEQDRRLLVGLDAGRFEEEAKALKAA